MRLQSLGEVASLQPQLVAMFISCVINRMELWLRSVEQLEIMANDQSHKKVNLKAVMTGFLFRLLVIFSKCVEVASLTSADGSAPLHSKQNKLLISLEMVRASSLHLQTWLIDTWLSLEATLIARANICTLHTGLICSKGDGKTFQT